MPSWKSALVTIVIIAAVLVAVKQFAPASLKTQLGLAS